MDCGRFLEVVGNNLDFKNQTSKRLRGEKNNINIAKKLQNDDFSTG